MGKLIIHIGEFDASPRDRGVERFFKYDCQRDWLISDYGRKVVETIDRGQVKDEFVYISEEGYAFPPDYLSGGAKTLISAHFNLSGIYPLSNLGPNCKEMLYLGCRDRDTQWYYTGLIPSVVPEQEAVVFGRDVGVLIGDGIRDWFMKNVYYYEDLYIRRPIQ
ncbi:MAG: DUF4869 domain-containing protein [Lachnospiraceae bacterium]|nr:DUF4869 domain-containing protein [Lachnospiraceae bacterium]